MARVRNACITWNNYPEDHLERISSLPLRNYLVFGYEVGKAGTKHLQMYVEFASGVTYRRIRTQGSCAEATS